MNLHTKGLLTLLISFFVFSGCQNPTGVGLEVDPDAQIIGLKTDTVSLRTVTLKDDSSRYQFMNHTRHGVQFAQTVFGALYDPVIGNSNVGLAVDMARPSSVPRIADDAVIDSVVLVLPYGLDYFGDTLGESSFTIEVRKLAENFAYNAHSARQWTYEPDIIGSRTISRFAYQDSVSITQHVDDRDTVIRSIPQLRIPLSGEFFKTLLSASVDSASLSTDAGFRNHVKGLYVSVGESTGPGGLATFAAVSDLSGVELTYRQSNGKEGDEAGIDTIRTLLPIPAQSTSTGLPMGMSSSVSRTYTAAVLEQLSNPNGDFETLYLQAPAGLRAKVSFPHIDDLKGRNIVINKAELVVYVDGDADENTFDYQALRLGLYREDIAGQRQPVPDGDMRQSPGDSRNLGANFGGFYDEDEKRYVFYLTSYIQDILEGKINNPEVYLAPVSPFDQTNPFQSVVNTGSRAVVGGASNANYTMKLNVYYTEIN